MATHLQVDCHSHSSGLLSVTVHPSTRSQTALPLKMSRGGLGLERLRAEASSQSCASTAAASFGVVVRTGKGQGRCTACIPRQAACFDGVSGWEVQSEGMEALPVLSCTVCCAWGRLGWRPRSGWLVTGVPVAGAPATGLA